MGQAAEDLYDQELSDSFGLESHRHRSEYQWETADGKVLKLSEMRASHLQNCIHMLERKLAERPSSWGGPDPDDSDGSYWGQLSEEAHNERVAENIEYSIRKLKQELNRRTK